MVDFKLSAQLRGHDADVRAVNFPSANVVLSASRDHTVRAWRKTAAKPSEFDGTITTQAHGFVNAITSLKPTADYPDGLVVSGGAETIIEVRKPNSSPTDNAERLLVGHSQNVCALDASPNGAWLVSGSWDGKAIVWRTDKWEASRHLLHEGDVKSVWAVLAYDEKTVITGSADTNIRIFRLQGTNDLEVAPWRTLTTGDVVRALCKLPTGLKGHPSGAEFASAGNDNIIRLWKLSGQEVGTLIGHESFIYSLDCLPNGDIVSAGEDRTLRVWRDNACIQTITHPAISVWTVAVCPENGDIVSGASDNMVRVFTRSAERVAEPDVIAQFEDAVKSSAIPQQQLGPAINKEKLDNKKWLETHAGSHDGQVKTIREDDGTIGAYQWSISQQTWVHVGTVVDSTGSSGKKVEYNGKEYDYVFDVDIEDGKPPLKLPYNLAENPYDAATRFLGNNNLPITYLDSVANFITQNTQGATIGQSSDAPSTDPYGTESRYKPGQPAQPSKPKYLPHNQFLALTQAKLAPALARLKTLNTKHIEAGNKHIAMNPTNVSQLESLVQALSAQSPVSGSTLPDLDEYKQIVFNIISQWPYGDRLPALDILRCLAAWPGVGLLTDHRYGNLINIAFRGALDVRDPIDVDGSSLTDFAESVDEKKLNANNVMMALRMVTNLFKTPDGQRLLVGEANNILIVMGRIAGIAEGREPIGKDNNNVQIALTSATFNFACFAYRARQSATGKEEINLAAIHQLCMIVESVLKNQKDSEVLFRALMTLGMILSIEGGDVRALAKTLEAQVWLRPLAQPSQEARIRDVAEECLAYLEG